MSSEITVGFQVQIRKDNLNEQYAFNFKADMTGNKGPTPGYITVPTTGIEIDLSALSSYGMCVIVNIEDADSTSFVSIGIRDPETNTFYPLDDILPGEAYPRRLSRFLKKEYAGTGTGTSATNKLWALAHGGSCRIQVYAFDR